MTYSSARRTILIGKETTWGTPVTPDKDVGLVQDTSHGQEVETTPTKGMGKIESQESWTQSSFGKGSLTIHAQNGRLLEYALGSVAHVETTSDWKHTFTISNNPPSMTIEIGNDDTTDTTSTGAGFLVENLEISQALNGILTFKSDIKGKQWATSASTSAVVVDTLNTFPQGYTTLNVNGTPATEVQEFSIKINKKVELSHGMGSSSHVPQQGKATEMTFEYSAKLGFDAKTYHDLMMGGTTPQSAPTKFDFEVDATNGTVLGSGRTEILFALENCVGKWSEDASFGDLVFVTISGIGTFKEAYTVDDISDTNWS